MALASRFNRLAGQFVDGLVGGAPFVAAVFLMMMSNTLGIVAFIAAGLWAIFYYFFADGLHDGQSYGKRWLGMRVVSDENGRPCTFGQSFLRNLLLAILGPIDWIFIFGDKHQRLGDKAAGTIVVSD